MWAQLMTMRLKPGAHDRVQELLAHLQAAEQPDSGLLRTTVMVDQADETTMYTLVVFDSEESARKRESDPRREAGLAAARAVMAEMFAGPPTFANLTVVADVIR